MVLLFVFGSGCYCQREISVAIVGFSFEKFHSFDFPCTAHEKAEIFHKTSRLDSRKFDAEDTEPTESG